MRLRLGRKGLALGVTAVLVAAALAVETQLPASLDVGSDTLIINGPSPVAIGARVLNRWRRAVWHSGLTYAERPGSIAHVGSDGSVRCGGVGDDIITISHGSLARNLLVRCRPIRRFDFQHVELDLSGPPKELFVNPIGVDRRPVTLLQGRATVRDTSIAELKDGLLYPRKIGATLVDVVFSGGLETTVPVGVTHRVLDTALSLVPGEMQTLQLAPGYYHIFLEPEDSPSRRESLVLAAVNANCATLTGAGPQDFYCIAKRGTSFVVRNPRPAGTRGPMAGRLFAVQMAHAWANSQK